MKLRNIYTYFPSASKALHPHKSKVSFKQRHKLNGHTHDNQVFELK